MRIVFIGTVEFSFKILEFLIESGTKIEGVCTKKTSNFNSDFVDLAPICTKNNIPYKYIQDINTPDSIEWIKKLQPDIIFCFGWSQLIQKELLDIPPMGVIGYHPSLLPQNRGRHPIIWALALNLKQTGSTFFFMDQGADSGDILSQKKIAISYEDDASSLYNKIINTAISQINEFLPLLKNNSHNRVNQDDTLANTWRKRSKKDGLIDFRMNSNSIYNLVRALTKPYAGAYVLHNEIEVSIWKVEEKEYSANNIECGKVLEVKDNTILIKTSDGAINIIDHNFKTIPKRGEYL